MAWDTILIDSPHGIKMNKERVYRYYGDPNIFANLLEDLRNKNAIVIYRFDKGPVLRRHNPKKRDEFLTIDKFLEKPDDPSDLSFHTARRAIEFHKVYGKTTDEVVVDIDPGESIKPNFLKSIVKIVANEIKAFPGVYDVEIRYSGGRGFYVIGKLRKKRRIDVLRKQLAEHLQHIMSSRVFVGGRSPNPDEIKLDLTAMKPGGSIRALYSLNAETGLASVKVPMSRLSSFNPHRDANPFRISKFPDIIKVKP